MFDPNAIIRCLTGHELVSPNDARLLTEAVDDLIDQIRSKNARILELEAENKRLRNMLGLGNLGVEVLQRRIEALSRLTEQTVTEAMVKKALHAYIATDANTPEEAMRAALKTAMEAGR